MPRQKLLGNIEKKMEIGEQQQNELSLELDVQEQLDVPMIRQSKAKTDIEFEMKTEPLSQEDTIWEPDNLILNQNSVLNDAYNLLDGMPIMWKEQLVQVFYLMKPGMLFQYEPRQDDFLEFLIWRFSNWLDKSLLVAVMTNLMVLKGPKDVCDSIRNTIIEQCFETHSFQLLRHLNLSPKQIEALYATPPHEAEMMSTITYVDKLIFTGKHAISSLYDAIMDIYLFGFCLVLPFNWRLRSDAIGMIESMSFPKGRNCIGLLPLNDKVSYAHTVLLEVSWQSLIVVAMSNIEDGLRSAPTPFIAYVTTLGNQTQSLLLIAETHVLQVNYTTNMIATGTWFGTRLTDTVTLRQYMVMRKILIVVSEHYFSNLVEQPEAGPQNLEMRNWALLWSLTSSGMGDVQCYIHDGVIRKRRDNRASGEFPNEVSKSQLHTNIELIVYSVDLLSYNPPKKLYGVVEWPTGIGIILSSYEVFWCGISYSLMGKLGPLQSLGKHDFALMEDYKKIPHKHTTTSPSYPADARSLQHKGPLILGIGFAMSETPILSGSLEVLALLKILGERYRLSYLYRCPNTSNAYLKLSPGHYSIASVLSHVKKTYFGRANYLEAKHAYCLLLLLLTLIKGGTLVWGISSKKLRIEPNTSLLVLPEFQVEEWAKVDIKNIYLHLILQDLRILKYMTWIGSVLVRMTKMHVLIYVKMDRTKEFQYLLIVVVSLFDFRNGMETSRITATVRYYCLEAERHLSSFILISEILWLVSLTSVAGNMSYSFTVLCCNVKLMKSLHTVFSRFEKILEVVAFKTFKHKTQIWFIFKVSSASNVVEKMQGYSLYDKHIKILYTWILDLFTLQDVIRRVFWSVTGPTILAVNLHEIYRMRFNEDVPSYHGHVQYESWPDFEFQTYVQNYGYFPNLMGDSKFLEIVRVFGSLQDNFYLGHGRPSWEHSLGVMLWFSPNLQDSHQLSNEKIDNLLRYELFAIVAYLLQVEGSSFEDVQHNRWKATIFSGLWSIIITAPFKKLSTRALRSHIGSAPLVRDCGVREYIIVLHLEFRHFYILEDKNELKERVMQVKIVGYLNGLFFHGLILMVGLAQNSLSIIF